MKSICVFSGSSLGKRNNYSKIAVDLGKAIAEENYLMVYGGGSLGLMGKTADSVLSNGGEVIGVITEQLNSIEAGHKHLTKLIIVSTISQFSKVIRNQGLEHYYHMRNLR